MRDAVFFCSFYSVGTVANGKPLAKEYNSPQPNHTNFHLFRVPHGSSDALVQADPLDTAVVLASDLVAGTPQHSKLDQTSS